MYYTTRNSFYGYVYIGIGLLLIIVGAGDLLFKIALLLSGILFINNGFRLCGFSSLWMHIMRWRM